MAKRKPSKPSKPPVKGGLSGNKHHRKPSIISNLKNGNTVAGSCDAVGISRETFYTWYSKDADFAKKVDEAKESRVQHVEDALYKNAVNGMLTAEIFYLCNRDPQRWKNVQKVEADINATMPIVFVRHPGTVNDKPSDTSKGS